MTDQPVTPSLRETRLPFYEALAIAMEAESDRKLPTLRTNAEWLNYGSRVELALLPLGYASEPVTPSRDSREALRTALREAVRLTPSSSRGRDARPYADRLFDKLAAALAAALADEQRDTLDAAWEGAEAARIDLATLAEAIRLWYVRTGRNPVTKNWDQPQAGWLIAEYERLIAARLKGEKP